MLKIVNDAGLALELDPDEVITVEKNNILFNDSDDLFQDLSYSSTAPFTDNNEAFFKLAHLVESPNSYYDISVSCFVEGIPISSGNIHFRIGEDGFDFNLEINYATINNLLKGVRLTEIRSADAFSINTPATMEALMMDTVQHPDKYPYIFFPVYNPSFGNPVYGSFKYDFVNNYDNPSQSSKAIGPSGTWDGFGCCIIPFFKLGYILQGLLGYLGFRSEGNFFTDASYKNTVIYSRQGALINKSGPLPGDTIVYDFMRSMRYMPNMPVIDFLKQFRERIHPIIDFDGSAGVATVETLTSILNSGEAFDLTPFIEIGIQQETPEKTGYTITLKSDSQDNRFKVTSGDDTTFPPLYRLVAGDGSSEDELDCSTTQGIDLGSPGIIGNRYCAVDQTATNNTWPSNVPPDMATSEDRDPTTLNNWPLRLMRFTGYNAMTGGGNFPCSEPVDLDENDKIYYRFLNDSKRLIIPVSLPPGILASLKTTNKYCFRTEGLNYCYCIIEKISYDLAADTEVIPAQIYVRTINADVNTIVTIQPINNPTVSPYIFGFIKAYFDNGINGLDSLNVQVVATGAGVGHNTYLVDPVVVPTTPKGTGGLAVPIILSNVPGADISKLTAEIRIAQPAPQYMEYKGVVHNFTWSGSYWYVAINMTDNFFTMGTDFYWIKF